MSLQCPLTKENHHLVNAKRLKEMKRGAILINTARGKIINEKDLIEALKKKTIAAPSFNKLSPAI